MSLVIKNVFLPFFQTVITSPKLKHILIAAKLNILLFIILKVLKTITSCFIYTINQIF